MSFKRVSDDQNGAIHHQMDANRFIFVHPEEVTDAPGLTRAEKRAILAAWASDRHAVEGAPSLRQLESGAIVPLDQILAALQSLDGEQTTPIAIRLAVPRRLRRRRAGAHVWRARRPDDDPPPPTPKPARMRLRAA